MKDGLALAPTQLPPPLHTGGLTIDTIPVHLLSIMFVRMDNQDGP